VWISDLRMCGSGRTVALRLDRGRIGAVTPAPEPDHGEQVVSAHGAWLTPGLIDGHSHWLWGSDQIRWLDLTGIVTRDGLRGALAQERRRLGPDAWLLAYRTEYTAFGDDDPHRDVIEDVTGPGPAYLMGYDLHCSIANAAALRAAGLESVEVPAPVDGVRERDGRRTGFLVEFAAMKHVERAIPARNEAQVRDDVLLTQSMLNALGFTGAQMMNGRDRELTTIGDLDESGDLTMRIDACVDVTHDLAPQDAVAGVAELGRGGRLWEVTGVKFWLDGVVESSTAWLSHPDHHGLGTTSLWIPPERYVELARTYAAAGFRVTTHAIGDAAISYALRTYAELPGAGRHRVEHLEVTSAENLALLEASTTVSVGLQPQSMASLSGGRDDAWSKHISDDRWWDAFRLADINRAAAGRLVLGTDWPAAAADPRVAIHWAVNRRPPGADTIPIGRPDQTLTAADIVRGYTGGAAWNVSREHELGQIAPGYFADLTLWSADPTDPATDPLALECLATIVDGRVVHSTIDALAPGTGPR
jgi:predicted amidohydrolase YtcJ